MKDLRSNFAKWLLRYAPYFSGLRHWPFIGTLLSRASRKLVPKEVFVWVQVREGPAQGLWMSVNPRTGRTILEGAGEPEMQDALRKHLRPGMSFYDLGANIGFFTVLAARLVGPQGRVVSFEADPENALRLRENIERNNFSNVTVEQKAVWSAPGTVTFVRADSCVSPDRGLGHISPNTSASDSILVTAVSLDTYTRTIQAPDFLKCDVEGAELEVFAGARQLLADKRPGILCEMHSEMNCQQLLKEFADFGYICTMIDETHVLALPK
jgi:FkbM family methyltransferase